MPEKLNKYVLNAWACVILTLQLTKHKAGNGQGGVLPGTSMTASVKIMV